MMQQANTQLIPRTPDPTPPNPSLFLVNQSQLPNPNSSPEQVDTDLISKDFALARSDNDTKRAVEALTHTHTLTTNDHSVKTST